MNEKGLFFDFDLKNFSTSGIDLSQTFQTRYMEPNFTEVRPDDFLCYENALELVKALQITKGKRYYTIVSGNFIFGDFFEALIVENNWKVKKMTISTLSLNENNVDSLANLLNGGFVDELNLIISGWFYAHLKWDLVPYLYKELDKNNRFQFVVADTHCKLCNFETECGLKISITGSANMRSSDNIENIVIEEGELMHDFNDAIHDLIIKKYKRINKDIPKDRQKTLRGKSMWETVKDAPDLIHSKF